MKKIITILATVIGLANTAHAGNITTTGEVIRIEPIYTQVSNRQPKQICGNVDIPVYGSGGNNNAGANALAGMIIGGILGKGVTGKDNGAAAGAVIGGIIGADKGQNNGRQIIGYRSEYRCSTEYQSVQSNIVNEYRVTFNVNGQHLVVVVNSAVGRRAYIGQRKQFRIRYQLLN